MILNCTNETPSDYTPMVVGSNTIGGDNNVFFSSPLSRKINHGLKFRILNEASCDAAAQSVTVKPIGCEFDPPRVGKYSFILNSN